MCNMHFMCSWDVLNSVLNSALPCGYWLPHGNKPPKAHWPRPSPLLSHPGHPSEKCLIAWQSSRREGIWEPSLARNEPHIFVPAWLPSLKDFPWQVLSPTEIESSGFSFRNHFQKTKSSFATRGGGSKQCAILCSAGNKNVYFNKNQWRLKIHNKCCGINKTCATLNQSLLCNLG